MNSVIEIQSEWSKKVTEGLKAREDKDSSQWKLGDLAKDIETNYGEDSIGKFASAIRVERKTLMNYRSVANSFPSQVRLRYGGLSFSHFAVLCNVVTPEAWLEQAINNNWSVETLREEVAKVYDKVEPPKVLEDEPHVYRCPNCNLWRLKDLSYYDVCRGHYKMDGHGKTSYE